jgi:hypothetical protein
MLVSYDTRDGEVLYISNVTVDIEQHKKLLINKYGSLNNIDTISVDSSKYGLQLIQYNYHRVVNGEIFSINRHPKYKQMVKDSANDRDFPLFENLYDMRTSIDFFLDDYIFNLRSAIGVLPVLWLDPMEIDRFDNSNEKFVVKWDSNVYPSFEEFSNEILEHGFIFPLVVRPKGKDGIYRLLDGSHRVRCTQSMKLQGLWDKKIMCIIADNTDLKLIDNPKVNYELGRNVVMHIPKKIIDKYFYISFSSIKDINEYIYEVEIHRYLDLVVMLRMYVFELTRTLQKYRIEYGQPYKIYPFINDEEEFNRWKALTS